MTQTLKAERMTVYQARIMQVGLASIALAVQRTGGSLQHPAEQLDDSLELMAARIEGGALPEAAVLGTDPAQIVLKELGLG